jgi:hypothetical protein
LCSGIKALSNEVTGINERTEFPDISENPVITHIQEIAPGAANDERKMHTSELARQVGPNTSTESENDEPSLRPESEKSQPANSHMASPFLVQVLRPKSLCTFLWWKTIPSIDASSHGSSIPWDSMSLRQITAKKP